MSLEASSLRTRKWIAQAIPALALLGCGSNATPPSPTTPADGSAVSDDASTDGSPGSAGPDASTEAGAVVPDASALDARDQVTCVTAADCPQGKLCVSYSSCGGLPGPCGASSTSACVDNPCDSGMPAACTLCISALCTGFSTCMVLPDAGAVTCGSGG